MQVPNKTTKTTFDRCKGLAQRHCNFEKNVMHTQQQTYQIYRVPVTTKHNSNGYIARFQSQHCYEWIAWKSKRKWKIKHAPYNWLLGLADWECMRQCECDESKVCSQTIPKCFIERRQFTLWWTSFIDNFQYVVSFVLLFSLLVPIELIDLFSF